MSTTSSYRAIADDNRRLILDLLRSEGPLRAGEIVSRLDHISQPAVSKHLRILRAAKLVQAKPDGRERLYSLQADALRQVAEWLQYYEPLWDERLALLKQLAEQGSEPADAQRGEIP